MNWRDRLLADLHWPSVGRTLAALAVAGAVAGGSVVLFGLYNVSAKTGHWPGVSAVLHTTFRNSVALRAHAMPPADLRSEAMVKLGAGHFDSACAGCHAAPGADRSATVRAMVPEPPYITEAVTHWEASEFHWIVHQGIKMSGMPGWPATRDDDVWPVVAFLLAVPDMTDADYAALTEAPDGQYCAMCHGTDGVSDNPHIPRLDILSERYIAETLGAYRDGRRDSGIMAEAMSQVPENEIAELAAHFADGTPGGSARTFGDLEGLGRALAVEGGTDEVPACAACHGPWPEPLNPAFPSLAGQYAPYLAQQLRLWRDGEDRGGGRASQLMHHAARDLTDDDIAALAAYYAALAPAKLNDVTE
ncbi:Cytochrome c4 precursor [Roseivivax jejudonensis]|uniref:Cytochrome c4 n=1 Tax=Roseivivax jejudonensis TaxID=1529041 RepID=A0A1X6Y7B6_9RHOB|nr:c-type cytochrome [Roseivivax jejudonensis]SLN12683.1 Cytochrome c4 precursor [Roseivivax jejudonensis]